MSGKYLGVWDYSLKLNIKMERLGKYLKTGKRRSQVTLLNPTLTISDIHLRLQDWAKHTA